MTPTHAPGTRFPDSVLATGLTEVRAQHPLVQCLTNAVVTNFTANALLALGAPPAMTDIVGEAGAFARMADAVLINLGTPTPEQRHAMLEAAAACAEVGTPWVLDPVAVGALPVRTTLARDLLAHAPTVVRGNASEVIGLCGGAGGRGTDSTEHPTAALDAARELINGHGVQAVAISGEVDIVLGADAAWRIPHGHEYLTRVTGGGCALGAVIAAFTAVVPDPVDAAVVGSVVWELAAERAARRSGGPGSFAVALLDEVAALNADDVARCAAVTAAEVVL
ncbi:hydroxyethylthiazole kinase [Kocuria sp.]|uniref:hydroxyethylthiazole kinase n=1 Tax=Kocuria sp. TaxID=1871328 RepID=UPI0026DF6264|nr:hydroxyethylthiazole kinase [Kocuria sp.]MDO5619405.1 hydroxyethylthiazole kinase [Kocuria sp.]